MRNNSAGGLVVFITSDTDFLKDVNSVVENYNFKAALLFHGQRMSKAPGMKEKVHEFYEWMGWLRQQMIMPNLQMHTFNKELEWGSPSGLRGVTLTMLHNDSCVSLWQGKHTCALAITHVHFLA